jgi:acetyl-CoA carboxylase biotin carboxylase subunit
MTVIEGIKTTIPMHLKILQEPDFIAGKLSTAFMERFAAPDPAAAAKKLAESA